jgi:hypothetical protein
VAEVNVAPAARECEDERHCTRYAHPPRCRARSGQWSLYPLAGLLLALPPLHDTGLLDAAREVYGRLRNGYYGLAATLLTLVFLALAGEPRAEGATRIPPGALGRVLGLDRSPEVKTIRRKLGELAAAGKAAELIMALARRHAAAKPDTLGFLYADGHARAYYGTRDVQKTHVARLKFPAPATMETWVADAGGDPVFMVVAEPSESLAGELKRLLPKLRAIVGEGREVTAWLRPGRLVPGAVRRYHRHRVRPADVAEGPRP